MGDGRMVPNFFHQALLGKPLSTTATGARPGACIVDDPVEGVLRLMRSPETRPVNVGNPVEYTVKAVAALILALSGSASELVFEPLPQDDPKQRRPDITRVREALDWEPRVTAKEGLSRTLCWFAERKYERESERKTRRAAG